MVARTIGKTTGSIAVVRASMLKVLAAKLETAAGEVVEEETTTLSTQGILTPEGRELGTVTVPVGVHLDFDLLIELDDVVLELLLLVEELTTILTPHGVDNCSGKLTGMVIVVVGVHKVDDELVLVLDVDELVLVSELEVSKIVIVLVLMLVLMLVLVLVLEVDSIVLVPATKLIPQGIEKSEVGNGPGKVIVVVGVQLNTTLTSQ